LQREYVNRGLGGAVIGDDTQLQSVAFPPQVKEYTFMSKLLMALIAGAFALSASAQTTTPTAPAKVAGPAVATAPAAAPAAMAAPMNVSKATTDAKAKKGKRNKDRKSKGGGRSATAQPSAAPAAPAK